MLIYLDMCSIHRPLDDKTQFRILVEAEAVLGIIAFCEAGHATLVSSDALEFEASRNPDPTRRTYARDVIAKAGQTIRTSREIEDRARQFNEAGLKPLDALHFACAAEARVDFLCTCDDRFLKRGRSIYAGPPRLVSPLEFAMEIGL